MQRTFLAFSLLLLSVWAQGQKQHKATSTIVQPSASQPAAMVVIPYTPQVVMAALENYKVQPDFSTKKHPMGYVAFLNTPLMQKNTKEAELNFRVGHEDQSKNQAVVYLLLNTRIQNGPNVGDMHLFTLEDAMDFLNNFALAVEVFGEQSLNKEIKKQTSLLSKVQKKEAECMSECEKLDAKKRSLQQKIAQSKKSALKRNTQLAQRLSEEKNALAYQKTAVEKQKLYVERLQGQRRTKTY